MPTNKDELAADIRQTAEVLSSSGNLALDQVVTIPIVLTTKIVYLRLIDR